jgi:hypothetical protein
MNLAEKVPYGESRMEIMESLSGAGAKNVRNVRKIDEASELRRTVSDIKHNVQAQLDENHKAINRVTGIAKELHKLHREASTCLASKRCSTRHPHASPSGAAPPPHPSPPRAAPPPSVTSTRLASKLLHQGRSSKRHLAALSEEKKRSDANFFLLIVESRASEKDSIVASRGGVVAAARSLGIWERKKKDRELCRRERRERVPRTRTQRRRKTLI